MDKWREYRKLKVHYGENGKLLCMPNTSGSYLYPHLTTNIEDVTCNKCIQLAHNLKEIKGE